MIKAIRVLAGPILYLLRVTVLRTILLCLLVLTKIMS